MARDQHASQRQRLNTTLGHCPPSNSNFPLPSQKYKFTSYRHPHPLYYFCSSLSLPPSLILFFCDSLYISSIFFTSNQPPLFNSRHLHPRPCSSSTAVQRFRITACDETTTFASVQFNSTALLSTLASNTHALASSDDGLDLFFFFSSFATA